MIKGNFLNEEQKNLKQKIMEELISALFDNIKEKLDILDDQTSMDIVFSCLIMFSREVLMRIIIGTGSIGTMESILNQYHTYVICSVKKAIDYYVKNEGTTH